VESTSRRTLRPFVTAGAVTLAFDILTKLIVYFRLPMDGGARPFIGDLVRWTHIRNAGAAFGLFQGNRFFFIAVSVVSILVILYLVINRKYRSSLVHVGFGMVFGGALGNLSDRIWLGVVIDFIDVGVGGLRWPVFNVADMGVTLGVVVLGLGLIREESGRHSREAVTEEGPGVAAGEAGEGRTDDAASSYNA
jgi:signal peptidase II